MVHYTHTRRRRRLSLIYARWQYELNVYKMAMVTFKVQRTATPAYLSHHLQRLNCVRNLRSSDTALLCQPFTKTDLARRGFHYSAAAVRNSLPRTVLESLSITVFKSRLKTHLFDLAHIKQ